MKLIIQSHHKLQQGFIPLMALVVLTVLAISIPVTTKLVQQSQENRSNAALLKEIKTDLLTDSGRNPTATPTKKPVMSTAELNRAPTNTPTKTPSFGSSVPSKSHEQPTATPTKKPVMSTAELNREPTNTPTPTNKPVMSTAELGRLETTPASSGSSVPSKSHEPPTATPTQKQVMSTAELNKIADSTTGKVSCIYSTGDWSVCKPSGSRTRVVTSSPEGCVDTADKPDSVGSCIYTQPEPPTATPTQKPVMSTAELNRIDTITSTSTSISCSSSNCSICSLSQCVKQSGCMVGDNGLCNIKKDTVETQKPSCSVSNCSACNTGAFCSTAGCYWEVQQKVCTNKPAVVCSSKNCSVCSLSECSNQSGCMVGNNGLCTNKTIKPETCGGAFLGDIKCYDHNIYMKCTTDGWVSDTCYIDGEDYYCIDNKCQKPNKSPTLGGFCVDGTNWGSPGSCNTETTGWVCINNKCVTTKEANEFYGSKEKCVGENYNLNIIYTENSCPKGFSCNRITGYCDKYEGLGELKSAWSLCKTDAECSTGFCQSFHGYSMCSEITNKEWVDKGNKSGAIIVGIIAASPIIAPMVVAAGGYYGPVLVNKIAQFIQNHPKFMTVVSKVGNVGDAVETILGAIACAMDPSSSLCENLVQDAMVPGALDGVGDLIESGANLIKGADKATDILKTADLATDIGDVLIDGGKAGEKLTNEGIDIFDKYGVLDVGDVPTVADYEKLQKAMAEQFPSSNSTVLVTEKNRDKLALWNYLTGVDPSNLEVMGDYILVEQAKVIQKYNMIDPFDYYGDPDGYKQVVVNLLEKNNTKLVIGNEKIKEVFAVVGVNKVIDETTAGFVNSRFPNTVFVTDGGLGSDDLVNILAHENTHLEQRLKIGSLSSEIKELEAYTYDAMSLPGVLSGEHDSLDYMRAIVDGMQSSVSSNYQERGLVPNFWKPLVGN